MSETEKHNYSFEMETLGPCLVTVFRGEISSHRYSEFRNDYNAVCRRLGEFTEKRLLIDLTGATHFGSLFIGIVVKLTVTIGREGGRVVLCGLSRQLKELMKTLLLLEKSPGTKINLAHFATREEALAALSADLNA